MINELPLYKFFNPEILQEILDNDKDIMLEVINEFISLSPSYMHEVESSRGDVKQMNFAAHKLKGALKFVGAVQLASIAQEIESISHNAENTHDAEISKIDKLLNNLTEGVSVLIAEAADYRNKYLSSI